MILVFTTAVLALHLLAMNLASAGPMLCVWLCRGDRQEHAVRERVGQQLAWYSMMGMLVGAGLGAILLMVPPSAGLHDAIGRFPVRAWWMAGGELLFSFVCLLVYWRGCGPKGWRNTKLRTWLHAGVAMLSVSNLLYHFPPLMVIVAKLSTASTWIEAEVIDRSVFLQHMFLGEVLSRCAHFDLASVAVAGVAVLWLVSRETSSAEDGVGLKRVSRVAAGVALAFSVLQLPVGVWVLMTLPGRSQAALMGGGSLGSVLFLVGIVSALLLMHRLGTIVLGETDRTDLRRACRQMLVVVIVMTATELATRIERPHRAENAASRGDSVTTACRLDTLQLKRASL